MLQGHNAFEGIHGLTRRLGAPWWVAVACVAVWICGAPLTAWADDDDDDDDVRVTQDDDDDDDDASTPKPKGDVPVRTMSMTISPLHAIVPAGEGKTEFLLTPRQSFAVVGGAGRLVTASANESVFWELGGQYNYYLMGDFQQGLQLGGELLVVQLSEARSASSRFDGKVTGYQLSPYIGYKVIMDVGFTFTAQAGYGAVLLRGDVTDSTDGEQRRGSKWEHNGLFNLGIGWSF